VKLAIVEILDRDGQSRHVVPVSAWPITIGRAVDCDVVLDDVHVAAKHATISETDGVLSLQVGESVNGAEVLGRRLRSGQTTPLPSATTFVLGTTRLRVRRSADALAPERALIPEVTSSSRVPFGVLVGAYSVWTLAAHWLVTDPGGRSIDYAPTLLLAILGLTIWCLVWATVSKIFRQRFEFWPHARIVLSYSLGSSSLMFGLPVLAFMIGWPFLSRVSGLAGTAILCAMIVAHLARIVPTRRRVLAYSMAALFICGTAISLTSHYQKQDRAFGEHYVAALPPPSLRLASTVPTATFIEEARSLKTVLDAHAKDQDGPGDELGDYEVMSARTGR
jgi:pSer/pThr/pTyr-binding forkhead associated (FHA) protein